MIIIIIGLLYYSSSVGLTDKQSTLKYVLCCINNNSRFSLCSACHLQATLRFLLYTSTKNASLRISCRISDYEYTKLTISSCTLCGVSSIAIIIILLEASVLLYYA